jgi:iodotyrosine deiodinase
MSDPRFVPLNGYCSYPEEEMRERAADFNQEMQRRRTVRDYSSREIPLDVIEDCLRTAGSAPSGAHRQPWHFVVVTDPEVKHRIREAAEAEEIEFYRNRAPSEWLEALAPLGTDENKEYLDTAPCLIAVFAESYGLSEEGKKVKNYYSQESVGIATGMLICALHHAGLATLTHTPSPMGFLNEILGRPGNERPFLLLVVGYPAEDAKVPDLNRKSLDQFASFS